MMKNEKIGEIEVSVPKMLKKSASVINDNKIYFKITIFKDKEGKLFGGYSR